MKASVCQSLARLFCCVGIVASAASASAQSISLPGTIQLEDFDQGAAEVAYHDLSAGNSGGEYRATDVDIEACDEGGFNVGWVYPGEWLKYTVNPSQSGSLHAGVSRSGRGRWRDVPHRGERRRPNRSNQHSRYRRLAELGDRHEVRREPQRRLADVASRR